MTDAILKGFDFLLLDSPDFKEDSVREEIIQPILAKLGYSASGENKILRSKAVSHPFVQVASGQRQINSFPDYLFQVDRKYAWVLDAKSPDEEIKSGENVEQVYFYAIHPEIRVNLFALCNGKEFIVFEKEEQKPLLYFHVSEIDRHWKKLSKLLSPEAFKKEKAGATKTTVKESEFDYKSITPLTEIKVVQKQAAKRHFGVHGYFTKQAWGVVQEYIKNFTQPGDLVLDPFGGGGVTLVEALMLGRKAIHIDLNPLSVFITKNLIEPVNITKLIEEFNKIKAQFEKNCPKTKKEIKEALKKYPYPKDIVLPKGSDVETIEALFSDEQLAHLAFLKHLIIKVKDENIRDSLMLAFSSTVSKINLTYHPSLSRGDNAGNCAVFAYYRYRIAKQQVMLDIIPTFETKLKKLVAAKREVSIAINETTFQNAEIYKGTATKLSGIKTESIDYIYTDPPYGSKIPYLDLSIMWNAWLDLPVTEKDYELEAIEGGEHHQTREDYSNLLSKSIKEMYRVLKFGRWMSFVFAHKDPAYWHLIVETAQKVGFEYAGAVQQRVGQSSFKKRQNPFTVLHGQLIINFKKVKNPQTIMKVSLGADITDIIMQTIEGVIAKHHGATLEQINDDLIIRGLELGFLHILSKEYQDLTPLLLDNFDYDEKTQQFHIRKNSKFKTQIDVNLRIRYYLLSFMRQMEHQKTYPTFDDIVLNIMPLLKNGITPEKQTILNILEKIAERVGEGSWKLKTENQQELF